MLEANASPPRGTSATSPIPWWLPVDESLALGAQIDDSGVRWLADAGYDTVVNLNTPSARNYWADEAAAVQGSGMHYVHFPLDCSILTPEKYEILRGILESRRGGRTFLHCAMNVKSSGMAHIWRVKELGHAPESARADLARTPGHESKWESFWASMGV